MRGALEITNLLSTPKPRLQPHQQPQYPKNMFVALVIRTATILRTQIILTTGLSRAYPDWINSDRSLAKASELLSTLNRKLNAKNKKSQCNRLCTGFLIYNRHTNKTASCLFYLSTPAIWHFKCKYQKLSGLAKHWTLFTVFFTELIDPARCINYALFPCIKRMTWRTNLNLQILTQYRTGLKFITTATSYSNLLIFWMNFWFHITFTLPIKGLHTLLKNFV